MAEVLERLRTALAERYAVEREIGRGGMAIVFLAEDLKHHRQVAIKALSPEAASAIGHDRFRREIETAARLNHPHILPLFDSGAAGEQLYYVMPYVEGGSLRQRLQKERQLPLEEAVRLAREVASALGHAHDQGLVHRDVKPENILLADGIALVADFGIARPGMGLDSSGLTQTGMVLGTPLYMSPEQALGDAHLDGRADLYSLGCVLYEMLAGKPPLIGPTPASLVRQHLTVAPPPVTAHRSAIPARVADVLKVVLSKVPSDRYATAARFAEALQWATTGAPTPAPRPTSRQADVPNNLPASRTSFIGRERELAECAGLLAEARLLTLTGVGGCGKTRLALELARGALGDFPDGVWFVDLAPVAEESRVVQTLAVALGVQEEPEQPLVETLVRRLADQRALILLDNCEHLVPGCAALVDVLLRSGPGLRVVATSREGLRVEGERLLDLRSLSVPAGGTRDLRAAESSEAVRLFVDRARAVAPDFALGDDTAPAVAEVCRRLDGIPLAIELAAARMRVLSAEQILSRLNDRFRLLAGGDRALPRHQTLRATMQWSYEHLEPEEQGLFRLLAVFAGGWTLEGATAVAGEAADEFAVLDLLSHLVEKSLVLVDRREIAETRCTMLETVREYARERLEEEGEAGAARTRHLDFYLKFAEAAQAQLRGPQAGVWLRRLDREIENLLAAHSWCDSADDGAVRGLRLGAALWHYWRSRGLFGPGLQVARAALGRAGAGEDTRARAQALYSAGALAYWQGGYPEAGAYFEEGVSISERIADWNSVALGNSRLGFVASARGDAAAARRYHERAVAIAREYGERGGLAAALTGLGELLRMEGKLEEAASRYEETLALVRELGDRVNLVAGLHNAAMVAIARGALERAREQLVEAEGLVADLGSLEKEQSALDVGSGLAAARGEWEQAARFSGASAALGEETGLRRDPADERFLAPLLARAREKLSPATFEASWAAGRTLSKEDALRELRSWLGVSGRARSGE